MKEATLQANLKQNTLSGYYTMSRYLHSMSKPSLGVYISDTLSRIISAHSHPVLSIISYGPSIEKQEKPNTNVMNKSNEPYTQRHHRREMTI